MCFSGVGYRVGDVICGFRAYGVGLVIIYVVFRAWDDICGLRRRVLG